jgi:phage-related protein
MIHEKSLKPLEWIGASLGDLRAFPQKVCRDIGYALHRVQQGKTPLTAKRLKGLPGVMEIREWHDRATYRTVYIASLGQRVYVLHCFQKKSKKGIATPKPDMNLIGQRLKQAQEREKKHG